MGNVDLKNEVTDKYSLRGRVFSRIRDDILAGVYKKGDSIIESKVSREYGVSRTPVREALRQLELEELVDIIPNKGAVVRGINAEDILDIYIIRSLVEGLAAKKCAESMKDSLLEQFDEIIMLSEFHLHKKNMEQLYKLDNRFHELMYEASGSRIFRHLLTDFHHYAQRVRKEALTSIDRAEASIHEHKTIVEAFRNKDGALAERLTNEHVRNTITNVLDKGLADHLKE